MKPVLMGHLKELLQNPHSFCSETHVQVTVWPWCCGANPWALVPVPHALVFLICTTEQESNHCICGINVKKRIRISIELTTIIIISIINVCVCKNYYSNICSFHTFTYSLHLYSLYFLFLLTAVPCSCWPLTFNRQGQIFQLWLAGEHHHITDVG